MVALVAILAEAAGTIASGILLNATGDAGDGAALIGQRVLYIVVASVVGGTLLSVAFAGTVRSTEEWVVAAFAAALSLWLGPLLQAVIAAASGSEPTSWTHELIAPADAFWMIAVFAVITALECRVWRATSLARVRRTYTRMWRARHDQTFTDRRARRTISWGLRWLAIQQTEETAALVRSVTRYYRLWLADSTGAAPPIAKVLAADIRAEMTRLFGPPVGGRRDDEP